jgi:hypothetical protein
MSDADSQGAAETGSGDGKILLIPLLILESLLLIPWVVLSAISGMGFDAGFSWTVVLLMVPFWAFPLLLIVGATAAFILNGKGRLGMALLAMIAPSIVSWCYFLALVGSASTPK